MDTGRQPPLLTKSRFKLAVECPTKLYYAGDAAYQNNSLADSFLEALAEGGYQVNALACLYHPGGVAADIGDTAEQVARTQALLAHEDVVIYEAAFLSGNLFARADILVKRGQCIELHEVKAKSYDPVLDGDLLNKKRTGIAREFLQYVQDVAFQRLVAGLAYPEFEIRCFLVFADKTRPATIDGLNQCFKARRNGSRVTVDLSGVSKDIDLGLPILATVDVTQRVDEVLEGTLRVGDRDVPFANAVERFAQALAEDTRIPPRLSAVCGRCEFRTPHPPSPGGARSGFHECWKSTLGWRDEDFAGGTVLDLWGFTRKDKLMAAGLHKLADVTESLVRPQRRMVPIDAAPNRGLSRQDRQWFQASGGWPGERAYYFNRRGFAAEMARWEWPLHLIDFETCTAAIPFVKGRRPYEQTAFQFSHHVLHREGTLAHATQFLARDNAFPNYSFLRSLREALSTTSGTVCCWAQHESTVLAQIRAQLLAEANPPDDGEALAEFAASLIAGKRRMVDLCKVAEQYFFHPATRGSSSLKRVLPALMGSSEFLRDTYSWPVYGAGGIRSLNFREPIAWWQLDGDRVRDPYELLPPLFEDLSKDELRQIDMDPTSVLKDGGAAMAAYARLQFEKIMPSQREQIESALLRYCELDTLAMVMAVQAWQAWSHS